MKTKRTHEKLDQAKQLTVWITRDLHARAVAAARADGRSLSNFMRHIIRKATQQPKTPTERN